MTLHDVMTMIICAVGMLAKALFILQVIRWRHPLITAVLCVLVQ